jgi:outer membrane protein OmpA-like peptidoglycan-associated protein
MAAAMRLIVGALCGLALSACATDEAVSPDAPFDPASCYARDVDVYFDNQGVALSAEARGLIDILAGQLHGCRIDSARIIGFAGVRGPEDVNEVVSAERAREIADYLVSRHRWPRERIVVAATGERGAVTEQGTAPMRRRGRIIVEASPPS